MRTKKVKLSEDLLIKAIRERHPRGAVALYDMYGASIYGIISRILLDDYLSEDLLQEFFLRIWNSFDQYDPNKGRLFTWMINVARHMAIDKLRSKTYRNDMRTDGLESCNEMAMSDQSVIDRLDVKLIRGGISKLREVEKKVIDLIYFYGYTHAEAADELSLPLGTVKTHWVQALRRLRVHYAEPIVNAAS